MTKNQSTFRPLHKRILRIILRILLSLFLLFVVLIIFIRSPWGQDIIVGKVTDYISEKIDTKFDIGKLYITFSGNVTLEDLYLEDRSQDTLVYSKYLEANVPFRPLIFGDEIKVDLVDWRGLKANVSRKDSLEGFNFQYIIDAFASKEETSAENENTSGGSTQFSLGRISFTDFDLTYFDEVTGMDAELILGTFELESKSIDLEEMKFHLAEINLSETEISYSQFKPSPPSEEQEESQLPWIIVDDLSIEDVNLMYDSSPDGTASEVYVNDFSFSDLDVNLENQVISLDELAWKDSSLMLEMESKSTTSDDSEGVTESKSSFSWPEWKIDIDEIDFQNHKLEFYQNGKRPKKGEFSAEALAFEAFFFKLKDIHVSKEESLKFNLLEFRFKENSGLVLDEFKVETELNSEETSLTNFRLRLNNSLLYANLKLNYSSLDELINSPTNSVIALDVKSLKADVKDAYAFAPDLKNNEQIANLAEHNFEGNFQAQGDLERLNIPEFKLNWGQNTELSLNGNLSHITEIEKLGFELKNLKASSTKKDLSRFVSEKDLGISLPKSVVLAGDFTKQGNDFSSKSQLKTSLGTIQLDGFFNSTNNIDYKVGFDIKALQLGELLKNDQLGDLTMQLKSTGKGNSLNELSAELSSTIDSIKWNTYTFSGLEIEGDLNNGKGDVKFDYSDENLQFDFVSNIELDSVSPKIDLVFNLDGIRTKELGLTPKDLRAKVLAKIQFEGNSDKFQLDAQLEDGLVVYDNDPYYLGNFDLSSKVDSTSTEAKISSQFLNGNFKANAGINGISSALQNHFQKYARDTTAVEKSNRPVNFDLEMTFIDSPILSEVFLDGLNQMDTLRASIHFHEEEDELTSKLDLPYLNFQDNEVQGLSLNVKSNGSSASFDFGFDNILAGPVDIAKTKLSGEFKDRQLSLGLDAFKEEKVFFSSVVLINFEEDDLYKINVSSEKLILNGSPWNIPSNNEIRYQKDSLKVSNFKLNRNAQEIELTDALDFEKPHFGIVFDNFKLSTISSYFNPDEKIAGGKLSGNLVLIEPLVSNGLVSSLKIEDLEFTEVPLGNLTLKAEATKNDDYELDLSLKDGGMELDADGIYHTNATETDVDFNIDLRKIEMQTIEKFASEVIKNSKGQLNGKFSIDGTPQDLNYEGFLAFDDVQFNLQSLNTLFQLKNERIDLTKNKIKLDNFTIADKDDNTFTANGAVDIEEITNPKFDLTFDAQDFQLLNSTVEDNDLYYGNLVFDASAKLNGNLDFPKVDLDLTIKESTDINYIVPESQASIEERDGVVVFVNKQNPDDILTQQDDKDLNVVISGIDFRSNISIQKKSKVRVVFNKRTQDNVSIEGGGDFKFDISETGKMNLVGKYEVSKGSVELNLYNIVKRKFNIASSSSVTWSGNPYNADLDLRAIYKIETAASSLMASQTAGENAAVQNRYKQQLPFYVYLDVGGELTSPELNFQLDMPESQQGAINGSVYGRISQINQQDDQLNKQVFSLLVLNCFYPESGSDGSQGGAASMARDNVNQALSDQLNTFSDKLTGNSGISLNFDVNSYTDYQGGSAQDRTEVDVTAQKKLMDDRLVVEAGSQMNVQGDQRPGESQAVVGNVSVEYLLTEDGRWKLRGFRKSEYENVIDGQVFVSGIALIFTREFNKFKVLWDKAYRESLEEKEPKVKSEADSEKESDAENEEKKSQESENESNE